VPADTVQIKSKVSISLKNAELFLFLAHASTGKVYLLPGSTGSEWFMDFAAAFVHR
jgi:hypothetical protein